MRLTMLNCSYCGLSEGMHVIGCPQEIFLCCGATKSTGHNPKCYNHEQLVRWTRPKEFPTTNRVSAMEKKTPEPEPYVSPHSLDCDRTTETYPFLTHLPAGYYDPQWGSVRMGSVYTENRNWHDDWISARERYAAGDGTTLGDVLDFVTETCPPPGPPIPVYKAAPEPQHERARTVFFAGFGILFCLIGLLPWFMALLS